MKPGIDYPGVAVAFFCHDGQGNFAFHKRGAGSRGSIGTWDCGGGGIEHGETVREAVMRELSEEYLCTGTIDEELPPNSCFFEDNGERHHWIAHPFIIRVNREDVQIGELDKAETIEWHTIDDLPTPLHPGVRQDIEVNIDILRKYSPQV